MADVWISRKRWTCKYCDVTINDDLPSRRHHESGGRHKQNVRQALENLYRKGEQERKDAEDSKKEMARIEALAAESYAKDQAGGDAPGASFSSAGAPPASSSSLKSAASARPKPPSSYQVAARANPNASAEPAVQAQPPVAEPGEWEQVVQPVPSASTSYATETSDRDKARAFRVREKVARLNDSDEEADMNTIKIKKRPRDETKPEEGTSALQAGVKKEESEHLTDTVKAEAGTAAAATEKTDTTTTAAVSGVKAESVDGAPPAGQDQGDGGGGGLFKKKRAGSGAGTKRVRGVI